MVEIKPNWITKGRDRNRELVRQRNKHTCQSCKKKWNGVGRRFDVHHLNGLCGKKSRGYDRKEELDGLIVLCHKCHYHHHQFSQYERYYGQGLTDEESYNKILV